jgi:hypothetical protein
MKKKKEFKEFKPTHELCEECKHSSAVRLIKNTSRKVFAVLLILLCVWIFIVLIFPLAFNIINMFKALTELYQLVSLDFKFIGGMFFFIVFWYVLVALINITIYIYDFAIRTYNNETN